MGVILRTINCHFEIDLMKFENYASETAKLFIENYPWYYMPRSVHQVLVHGSRITSTMLLPIGSLSEEAQEARNKDSKH